MTTRLARRSALGLAALLLAWQPLCAAVHDVAAERELGAQFALEAQAKLPLLRDPEITSVVRRVGQRIVGGIGEQPFEYRFFVLRDSAMNAFAVPGGYVFVNSGLLARVDNEDELAGVLGHEIAHVNAHHFMRQQAAVGWLDYASLLGVLASMVEPAVGAVALGAAASVKLKYRRDFEDEADRLGLGYIQRAGFAPRGMLDFFEKMRSEEARRPTDVPPYLLTHPLSDKRVAEIELALRASRWKGEPKPPASRDLERARLLARLRGEHARDVVPAYRSAVTARPNDAEARYLLGVALLESGSYEAARETLEQARSLGHEGVDRDLGRALLRLRRPAEARALLARAAESRADDPLAQMELARTLEALDEDSAAAAAYRRAVALDPDLDDAQRQLGLLAGRAGALGEGHYHLGKSHFLRGEYAQALTQFEKAEAELPAGAEQAEVKATLPRLRAYLDD